MEDDRENVVSCSPDSGVCCDPEVPPARRTAHRLDPTLCNRRLTLLKSLSQDSEYSLDTSLFDAEEFLQDMGFAGTSDPTIPDRFLPSLMQRLSRFPEAEMESLHDRIIQSIGCFKRKEGKRRLFRNLSMGKDSRAEHYGKSLLICPASNYPLLRSNTGPAAFPFEEGAPSEKGHRLNTTDSGHGSLDPAGDERSIPESPIAILVSAASTERDGSEFDSRQTSLDETSDTEDSVDNDFCDNGANNQQFSDTVGELQKLTEQLSDSEDLQSESGLQQVGADDTESLGGVLGSDVVQDCSGFNGDVASIPDSPEPLPAVSGRMSPVVGSSETNDGKIPVVLKHPLRRTSNANRYGFKTPDPFESLRQQSDLDHPDCLLMSASEILESELGNMPPLLPSQVSDDDSKSKGDGEESNSDADSESARDVFQFDRTQSDRRFFSNPKHTRDDSLTNFLSSMLDTTDKSSDLQNCAPETLSEQSVDDVFHVSSKDGTQGVVKAPNRKRRVLKRMSSSMQCCEDEDCKHHDGLNAQDAAHPLPEPSASIDRRPKMALRNTSSAPLSSDSQYMHPFGTLYQKDPHSASKGNGQNRGKYGSKEAHRRKERRPCKRRRYLSCPSPQNFIFVPDFQGREMSASMRDLHSMGYECPLNDPHRLWCSCCEMASFSDSSADRCCRDRRVTNCPSPVRSCFRNPGAFSFPFASRKSLFPSRLSSTPPKYYLFNSSPDIRCVSPELVGTRNQFQPLCHQFGGLPPPMDNVPNSCCCPFHCDSPPRPRSAPRYARQNSISYADSEAPLLNHNSVTSRYCPPLKRSDVPCKHSFSGLFSPDGLPHRQNHISHSDSEVNFPSNLSSTGRCTASKGLDMARKNPLSGRFSSENIASDGFPRRQNNVFHADFEPPMFDVSATKNGRCCAAPKRSDMTSGKSPVSGRFSLDRLPLRQNSMSYEDSEAPFPNNVSITKNSRYCSVSDVDCWRPKTFGISRRHPSDCLPQRQNDLPYAYSEAPFQNDVSVSKNDLSNISDGVCKRPSSSRISGQFLSDSLPRCQENIFTADPEAPFQNNVSVTKNDPSYISDMVCERPSCSKISGQLLSDGLPQCQENMSYADPEAPITNMLVNHTDPSYIIPKGSGMAYRRLNSSKISGRFSSDRLPQRQDSISYADSEATFVEKNPVTTDSRYRSHMTRKHPSPFRISGQFSSDDLQQHRSNMSYADFEAPLLDKISSTKDNRNFPPINGSDMTCKHPTSSRISEQFPPDRLPHRISSDDFEAPLLDKISSTKVNRNFPPVNGSDMTCQHPTSSRISEQFPPNRLPHRISSDDFEAPLVDIISASMDSRNCPPAIETDMTSKRPSSSEMSSDPFVTPRSNVDPDCPPSSSTNKREALLEKKIRIFSKFLANLGNLSKSIPDNGQKGKRATTHNRKLSHAASLPDKKAHAASPADGGARRCTTPPPRLLDCHPSTEKSPVMNPACIQDGGSPVYENRVLLRTSGDPQKHSFQPVMFTSSVSMYISGDGSKDNSEENAESCKRNDLSQSSRMPFNVVTKELEDLQRSIHKAKEMRLCASKELQLLQALLSGDEPHKKRVETSSSIATSPERELSSEKKSETLTDLRERKKRDESEEASFWQEEIKRVKMETEEAWQAKLDRMEARLESQEEELRRLQSDKDNLLRSLESQTLGSPVCHCKSNGLQNGLGRIDSAFEDDEEYLPHKPSIPIQSTRQECDRLQERLMKEEQRADQLNILLNQKLIEHNKLQITLSKQTKEMIELEKSYLQLQCRLKRGHKPSLPRLCSRDSPFASKNLCPGPSPPASPHP